MDAAELRPLGIGEILDVAIKVYRARFATLVKVVGIVVGPVSVVTALVQVSSFPDGAQLGTAPEEVSPDTDFEFAELGTFVAGLVVVGVLSFIASQLATAASFRVVSGAYLDEEPGWKESLRFARSRLGPLVWLSIVLGFFLVLGFLACIVPGVYLWGAWAVAVPVLLLEDHRGQHALRRSRALVRGRWWPTAAVLVLAFLLAGIVQSIFSGLLAGAVVAAGTNDLVNAAAQAVANTAASVLTTPFSAAVTTAVYFDLRVRKEGFDLELLARRVGVEPPDRPDSGLVAPPPSSGDEAPFWPPPPWWRPPDG
jgi:hypothetical protein